MLKYHFKFPTEAAKITGCAASYVSRASCPDACPLKNENGCYAATGNVRLHWRRLDDHFRGDSLKTLCHQLQNLRERTPYRHAIAGDLPGIGNRINGAELDRLSSACRHLDAWTFTHKPVLGNTATAARNRDHLRRNNTEHGLTVNLSADNPAQADALLSLRIGPVVTLLPHNEPWPERTPAGAQILVCPFTTGGRSCIGCHLCTVPFRAVVVGFPVHGMTWRAAEKSAQL